jgi:hypothetical protein
VDNDGKKKKVRVLVVDADIDNVNMDTHGMLAPIFTVIVSSLSGFQTMTEMLSNEVVGAEQGRVWRLVSDWGHTMGWFMGSGC